MDEMFITCILDIVDPKRELSPQAVVKLVKEKFTSANKSTTSCQLCGGDTYQTVHCVTPGCGNYEHD